MDTQATRSFTPATLQRLYNESALAVSEYLWTRCMDPDAERKPSKPSGKAPSDFFALLSPFDCEDIVGMYLQEELGYRLQPSTCKNSTMTYEYVLIHPLSGERAVAQVKSGDHESLNQDNYLPLTKHSMVYLFAANGVYLGTDNDRIIALKPQDVESFVRQYKHIMPERIQIWLDVYDSLQNP